MTPPNILLAYSNRCRFAPERTRWQVVIGEAQRDGRGTAPLKL